MTPGYSEKYRKSLGNSNVSNIWKPFIFIIKQECKVIKNWYQELIRFRSTDFIM